MNKLFATLITAAIAAGLAPPSTTWYGVVPRSTMRIAHNGKTTSLKMHGAKECARRLKQRG